MARKSKSELIANHITYLVHDLVIVQDRQLSAETKSVLRDILGAIVRYHASEVQDETLAMLDRMLR